MSWLTPRRRGTTGNLRTLPNGQVSADPAGSPLFASSAGDSTSKRNTASALVRRHTTSTPKPPATSATVSPSPDGSLFYAYAREGDELQARYLLTFASAAIANEWWLLLQIHFPDSSRPGPQLFSFKTEDILAKAWKHPSFAHLKSKWMYISFSDTSHDGLGGAAQSIIPVQDMEGNMMGGSRGSSVELEAGVRREAKEVKDEVIKMEDYFQKMMEAVERNTQQIAELTAKQTARSNDYGLRKTLSDDNISVTSGGQVDMGVLSGHFVRLNDLMAKHSQRVEDLAKKHYENEQRLRRMMESIESKNQRNDELNLKELSSHLDRIQSMMESSTIQRKDSAEPILAQEPQSLQIDWSPLTERLGKVQEAIEQNSALVKALFEEGAGNEDTDKTPAPPLDLTPLTQHLERIHSSIEQQSGHMRTLVEFAGGQGETTADPTTSQHVDLAPLSEHLEQIYNSIEEGNKLAKDSKAQKLDLAPLERHFQSLRDHSKENKEYYRRILESEEATRGLYLTPLTEHIQSMREATESNTQSMKRLAESHIESGSREIDITPLTPHLQAIRSATEKNTEQVRSLVDSHQTSATASPEMDFTPLTDRLNNIHSTLERQASRSDESTSSGDAKFLMNALSSHLSKIQGITEQNANHVNSLYSSQSSSQEKMYEAITSTSEQVSSLMKRNQENEARIDSQNSQMRELMSGQREMVEVMRQLTKSIVAQSKGSCDHVVVPPPRKMSKKVVGFVYDA